jgi:N-acetylmuramoyl-L-alanine amidase-like protein
MVAVLGSLAMAPAALADGAVHLEAASHLARPFTHSVEAVHTFQLVGVHWRGPGAVRLQARTTRGAWTRWVALERTQPVWTGPARRIRLRRSGTVRDLRVTFVTSPRVASPRPGTVVPRLAVRPSIVTRAGWHANEAMRRAAPLYASELKMVFVHHTDTATSAPCSESARIVRGIYAYHVRVNGWNDIGYNFLVDRCGTVFEGRYGGMTKPVIGAQTGGFNTYSSGIAVIGTYTSARPPHAAVRALERLIAWRLDIAHVNPAARVEMTSSGNPRYRAGRHVILNAVSGHRDGYPTSCPGSALYALLPRIRAKATAIGLPKIWNPRHVPNLHRIAPDAALPLLLRAKFSRTTPFTLTIRAPGGEVIARRRHTNHHIRWRWSGRVAVLPGGTYRWSISAPRALGFSGILGTLPLWGLRAPPDGFSVTQGTVTGGDLASLAHPEGATLDIAAAGGSSTTELVTEFGLPATRPVALAGTLAGASVATTGGGTVGIAFWDFGSSSWVDAGSCTGAADRACKVQVPFAGHELAAWDAGSSAARMRVRYTFPGAASVDSVHTLLSG